MQTTLHDTKQTHSFLVQSERPGGVRMAKGYKEALGGMDIFIILIIMNTVMGDYSYQNL